MTHCLFLILKHQVLYFELLLDHMNFCDGGEIPENTQPQKFEAIASVFH